MIEFKITCLSTSVTHTRERVIEKQRERIGGVETGRQSVIGKESKGDGEKREEKRE